MEIFPGYVVPENEIDELFVEEEMDFLIKVCIRENKIYKDFSEFKSVIKERYNLWRNKYHEKRRIQ